MNILRITVGAFASNCYIVWPHSGAEALVIDPGYDAPRIIAALEENEVDVAAYLITHGHMDHVSALAEVAEKFPAPIAMHPVDERWAFTAVNASLPYYPTPNRPAAAIERHFEEGQEWVDAGLRYRIIETPGHSPGGICLYFEEKKILFSGDTLFQGSVGRTDLRGGNAEILAASLQKLMALPDNTKVYPGHGEPTTILRERTSNPYIR